MTQDVDPDALFDAARVYNNVRTSAASAVNELASVLNGSAGMGGTDTGAHAWAIQYDPLATSLIEAATVVVEGAGQCYDLLYATGMNHLNADGQSAISGEAVLAMPPMGRRASTRPLSRWQKADTATSPSSGIPSRPMSRASCGRMVIRTTCEPQPMRGYRQPGICELRHS